MSFFSKIFGGGKGGEPNITPVDAIQRLKEVEEMLNKKQDFLEKKVEIEMGNAKRYGMKNKKLALSALKKKKRFEKQLQQIDGTLTTIEFQREALENAQTNTQVLKIMGVAAKALKNAHSDVMDIDKVHDLMDDIQEQQELANEISEAISNPTAFGSEIDEDDLMKELEELEQEDIDRKILDVAGPTTENLPSPPTAEPKKKADEDEDELKELLAWAS